MRTLTPITEGNYLTQVSLINENERIFSDKIYLAVNDSPESWMEVTPDYKAQWEVEHKEEPESDDTQR